MPDTVTSEPTPEFDPEAVLAEALRDAGLDDEAGLDEA